MNRARVLVWIALTVAACLPARASETVELKYRELWRTEAGDDAPYFFGTPGRVRADTLGGIYVLDTQLQELHSFESSGEYRGRLIRQGDGPGELNRCYQFAVWPDGRLAVPRRQGSVAVFDLDGTFLHSLIIGDSDPVPLGRVIAAFRIADGIVVRGTRYNEEEGAQENVLGIYSPAGVQRRELFAKPRPQLDPYQPTVRMRELDHFFEGTRFVLGDNGLVYVAPDRDAFQVDIFDLQGSLVGTVSLDWPEYRRSSEEMEEARKNYAVSGSPGAKLPDVVYEIEVSAPTIRRLLWIAGSLWVEVNAKREHHENIGRFVIIGSGGTVEQVRDVVVPGVTLLDRVEFLEDGRIVVVKNYRSAVRSRFARANMKVGGAELSSSDEDQADEVFLIVFGADR